MKPAYTLGLRLLSLSNTIKRLPILSLLAFLLTLPYPDFARADWLNLTGAENSRNILEIFVEKDHVKIKLEVFVQDLTLFEELIPDEMFPEPIPGRPDLEERLKGFSENTLQVITDTGERLTAKLDIVEPRMRMDRPSRFAGKINPYTRRVIPGPPDDKRVLYVELTYPYRTLPKSLTFVPPLDERGRSKASVGFTCKHLDVPVIDFRNLTSKNVLQLEWDDPWYSSFKKKQLTRTLKSGVRTYLYIEPFEVRHEILVRVKDMMTWMDFDLRGDFFIEEDEFNPVREQVANFFMERENVLIDGKKNKPILDRTAFVESSIERSRFIEIPERVPLNTAMIGVIITYLTDGIPQEVVTTWDLFSDRVNKVTASMTDPAGPFPYELSPDDNILRWNNYLKNYTIPSVENIDVSDSHRGFHLPILSLVCLLIFMPLCVLTFNRYRKEKAVRIHVVLVLVFILGAITLSQFYRLPIGSSARASQITNDDAKKITLSLLKNIYRAFDFREEDDVYDKLAVSVSGDLLSDIYLQSRKSMIIEQAGGAQAKVIMVEVLETAVKESQKQRGALDIRTKWTAIGSVGHWGHVHTRQNIYDAILTLAIQDGFWKITGIELLEEKRMDPYAQPNTKSDVK